jgi:hypothetical protein
MFCTEYPWSQKSPKHTGLLKGHLLICSQVFLEFAPVVVMRFDPGCKVFKMWPIINGSTKRAQIRAQDCWKD